uniref:Molybdate-anion transporter n=1 Tax=Pseudo-nitzschia australis TaxID=44445 RepID=A0A7S4EFD8_9STRA
MTRLSFITLFLLVTLMAPVSAFGSVATMSASTLVGTQQQQQHVHPSSALFIRNGRRTGSAMHQSQRSTSMETRMKMCAGISAPSLSLISNVVGRFRGGASAAAAATSLTPTKLFNTCLIAVAMLTTAFKVLQAVNSDSGGVEADSKKTKPDSVKDLQRRFLSVFWLLRCADWLQGPYFYEVYASKVFGGAQASMSMISRLFLTGFASTALFGPSVGRAIDSYGRKKGTLAFSMFYAIGALSTKSPLLMVLLFGRVMSGIGTSLLFSAPESWLVGESQKSGDDPNGEYLGETFGLAYAGDSVVAIIAGQLASLAATKRGPTGPFELSTGFLAVGGLLAALLWKENLAAKSSDDSGNNKPSIMDAINVVRADPKIMMVGGVQSLFEAAMYIFVLQWPPAIAAAVAKSFGEGAVTPYGTVFSCFMACCLFGSTLFGQFAKMKGPTTEGVTAGMLATATIAMSTATYTVSSASMASGLPALIASFFAFEACVGMYFPSIGTLRSKYIPDSHRSVIMNLFGIPLNVLVVSVFMFVKYLGVNGALGISSAALALATLCMVRLNGAIAKKADPALA